MQNKTILLAETAGFIGSNFVMRGVGKMTYQYHSKFNIENSTLEDSLCYNKENLLNPWFVVKK